MYTDQRIKQMYYFFTTLPLFKKNGVPATMDLFSLRRFFKGFQ